MSGSQGFTRRDFLAAASALLAGMPVTSKAARSNQEGQAPNVRFRVRTPLQEKTIRERALLLQQLGYQGLVGIPTTDLLIH